MSDYTFKSLNTIDTKAVVSDDTTIMGFENGVPIQMPMGAVKSGGGVFIIDTTSTGYKPTDPVYGDSVKEAIFIGNIVWIYDGSRYYSVFRMSVGSDCGQAVFNLWYGNSNENLMSLYISSIE